MLSIQINKVVNQLVNQLLIEAGDKEGQALYFHFGLSMCGGDIVSRRGSNGFSK